jgi:hypothetical protein
MLDTLPAAMIISNRLTAAGARSALPDAPVVPDAPAKVRRPRAPRTRSALSHALERASRAVAPTPSCSPAP